MPLDARFDVIVAGRGAVGSAVALGLAQQGVRTLLVGRAAPGSAVEPAWDPRVYAMSPASLALFDRLRVARQIDRSRIAPIYDMELYGDDVARPGRLGFSAWSASVQELATVVEHRNLQRALDLGLDMQSQLTIVDGAVDEFTLGARCVEVSVSGAPIGRVEASLLVAADGADSPIRAHAGIAGHHKTYDQCGVVADFECDRAHADIAYQWFLGDSVLALLPLPPCEGQRRPSTHVSMVWSVSNERAVALTSETLGAVGHAVEQACAARLGKTRCLTQPRSYPLSYFVADTFVQPRLALVGDAAHVMHPLAGQGLNVGFADATALLDTIAAREPVRDLSDVKLLRRYARARAEDIALMMRATDGVQRLFAFDHPFVRLARNAGMNLLDRVPVLKTQLVNHAVGR